MPLDRTDFAILRLLQNNASLSNKERGLVDRFLSEIVEVPEVRFAFLVTGPHDFVVHIVARDMQHLKDLVLDKFTNRPAVTRVETSIIYEARVRHELPCLGEPL
jgi:DNA-binding Lrp family transcriptional regulator